jgi:mercuric ion transport protein
MIFFFFSLFASLLGGLKSGLLPFSFTINLAVDHPLSGIISFWPFIVILMIVLLAILWYQSFRNMRNNKQRTYLKTRRKWVAFPAIITVAMIILIASPYIVNQFIDQTSQQPVNTEHQTETSLTVHGMTCTGCEQLINKRIGGLAGVDSVNASHTLQQVFVIYDNSKVSLKEISQNIEQAGYTVVFE